MKIAPHIKVFLDVLINQVDIGISPNNIIVGDKKCGVSTFDKQAFCDRFRLSIPYGGQITNWEVVFNLQYPEHPPDFIFDCNFRADISRIDAFANWDSRDPTCLARVIQGLLNQFREYEADLLENFSRLHFEYTSLLHQTSGLKEQDIETCLSQKNKCSQASFLIRLPIDFSKSHAFQSRVSLYHTVENNKQKQFKDSAILLVTFHNPEGNKITPQLILTPRVEHALGGNRVVRIPTITSSECLIDYVPHVCDIISSKLENALGNFELRKEFIACILSQFGRSIVEFDAESYNYISLLLEHKDFYFVLKVIVGNQFPKLNPVLTLKSIYHTTQAKKPFNFVIKNYPYNARWTPFEMATRLRATIIEYIPLFKTSSIKIKH